MKINCPTNKKGFTLIELLVVIGILAALLAITLIAINPARQFGQANNAKRESDVTQILNAVGQYIAENKGQLPPAVLALTAGTPASISTAGIDICAVLVPNFLPALPTNPTLNTADVTNCAASYSTGYSISRDANNRITISADTTDNSAVISRTR